MIGDESSPIKMNGVKSAVDMSTVLQRVFTLMMLGLLVTGVTAFIVVNSLSLLEFMLDTYWIWLIAELVIVFRFYKYFS